MSESKHTPGPWEVVPAPKTFPGVRASGGYVCFIPSPTHYRGQDERYEKEVEERNRDARLIAAAPDLLEALENIENDDGHIPEKIWAMRNAAIAKAKGE